MKPKQKTIPCPTPERKVSPIVGRGARAKSRKRSKTGPTVFALPMLNQADDDDEENFDEPVLISAMPNEVAKALNLRAQQSQVRKPSKVKGSSSRGRRSRKTIVAENATVSVQAAVGSEFKNDDIDHVGNGPQSSEDVVSDSVSPPTNACTTENSRKHDIHSTPTPVLEEPTANSEQSQEILSIKRQALSRHYFGKLLQQRPRIIAAFAAFALLMAGFFVGKLPSGPSAEKEGRAVAKPSPELVEELNQALALIETGESFQALKKIQTLSVKHPDVYSLDYLAALAAMQSGDLKMAHEKASLSIQKNQKVSDSLVLLSMTESGVGTGGKTSLRDPKLVRESLLREAVESDVANPFPMIELASFLRSQKRDDEAIQLLKAANARLHPIDTHVVVATSIQLMQLQQTSDDQLPAVANEGSISEIFASIYISLRKKDYKQAAVALDKGRHQASPDLFAYLINDPVFKPFHSEPVMTRAL